LSGIRALSTLTGVDVVTFYDDRGLRDKITAEFQLFWGDTPLNLHLVESGKKKHAVSALLAGRFESTTKVENSQLGNVLDSLGWDKHDRLMILDDIILAPLLEKYGKNSILSPHDCMSQLFKAHFLSSTITDIRKYVQYRLAQHYEKKYLHLALLTHVISHRDRVHLEKANPKARFHVISNADMLNPLARNELTAEFDVLIWGDLSVPTISAGVKKIIRFLEKDKECLKRLRIMMVGKLPLIRAKEILGYNFEGFLDYAQWLEDENGSKRTAKIYLIPDLGGAGMKNRCINLLAAGKCLACLYPQMEGIEKTCDRGSINAIEIEELLLKVKKVIASGSYQLIADTGKSIYEKEYSLGIITKQWREMIERTMSIKQSLNNVTQ